jgi:hypothetical protein
MAADPVGTLETQFAAVRFKGSDSAKLVQAFRASSQASGDLIGSLNIGGKDAIKPRSPGPPCR